MAHAYEPEHYRRPDCDTREAECKLSQLEKAARSGTQGSINFAGRWLTVFMKDDSLVYRLEQAYPTDYIARKTAVSFLARA